MLIVRDLLLKKSADKNVWTFSPEFSATLINAVSKELFSVVPEMEERVIKSAKSTCFMLAQGKLTAENVVFEFLNYLLGRLFRESPDDYLKIRASVRERIPQIIEYNLSTLDEGIAKKYFPNFQAEYEFLFNENLVPKKSC